MAENEVKKLLKKIQNIHFVGIGGSGMSGIAEVLINLGYRVSGSDLEENPITQRLKDLGAIVHRGHRASNLKGCHVVVVSTAVSNNNIEVISANKRNIPVIPRAEMLAELMRLKYSIAISGTHGKTTTTSMASMVLAEGGFDPTVVIGGRLNNIGSNAKLGSGDYLVAEADESDGSFLKLTPTIAVITNIDTDHLDFYGNIGNIKKAFIQFANKVPFYGSSILCKDDSNVRSIMPNLERKYYTYGLNGDCDFQAKDIESDLLRIRYSVFFQGKRMGDIKLNNPGFHNVYNSLAACAVGVELGVGFNKIKKALSEFIGVGRRLEVKGKRNGVVVIDDYAHHPTEINITLKTIREGWNPNRLLVIFQPHRYSRTKILASRFPNSLIEADLVYLTDIYPAGEKRMDGISSRLILNSWPKKRKEKIRYIPDKDKILQTVLKEVKKGDVVATIGAGNVYKIGEEIVKGL